MWQRKHHSNFFRKSFPGVFHKYWNHNIYICYFKKRQITINNISIFSTNSYENDSKFWNRSTRKPNIISKHLAKEIGFNTPTPIQSHTSLTTMIRISISFTHSLVRLFNFPLSSRVLMYGFLVKLNFPIPPLKPEWIWKFFGGTLNQEVSVELIVD